MHENKNLSQILATAMLENSDASIAGKVASILSAKANQKEGDKVAGSPNRLDRAGTVQPEKIRDVSDTVEAAVKKYLANGKFNFNAAVVSPGQAGTINIHVPQSSEASAASISHGESITLNVELDEFTVKEI
jgi:hypothetical protein